MKPRRIRACLRVLVIALVGAGVGGGERVWGQVRPASRPGQNHRAAVSDFPEEEGPATLPTTQGSAEPVALRPARFARDEEISTAIDRGVGFLLGQFKDGDIFTARDLSEPQRQSLYALCAYALAQTGQSTDDPRISVKGKLLPAMLDRLKSFQMVSDIEKMNRPVTYGRSLRAAALATYDRPVDRAALKEDVAWLVRAQIDGAYTYDDFYTELMKQGMKGSGRINGGGAGEQKWAGGGFELGGIAAIGLVMMVDGPYPPPGNFAKPPTPGGGPVQGNANRGGAGFNGGGGNGIQPGQNYNTPQYPNYNQPQYPNYNQIFPNPPMPGPRPSPMPYIPNFPRPTVPWWRSSPPRIEAPRGNYIGPKVPNRPGSVGGGGLVAPGSVRPQGDNMPAPQLDFLFPWDNSNSQYGVLGVWAGAEVGIEVPDAYWQAVQQHWQSCQLANGQWSYRKGDPQGTLAMTAGGVASLLITHEYLDGPMLKGQIGREPYGLALATGLSWMDRGHNGLEVPTAATHYMGYDLFGIGRVGLNSGYKYLGAHDWYRELSGVVVAAQFPNGAWGHDDHGVDTIVDTAYSLLFLARGRPPIVMTKLKFEKYWDNRPRDVANLAKYAGKQLERQLNWQVVGIEHSWDEWFDSPVVYIASHAAPKITERDYQELAKFTTAGGLIFTHADASSGNFDQWVAKELAGRIAPGHPLVPIPDTDPIYSVHDKLTAHRKLMGVSNGARWLLVHSPNDLALSWQMRSLKTRPVDFQLGLNVFLYAAGRADFRNRLDSPYVAAPPGPPGRMVKVARLSYDGNWDPEPAAWSRFSRVLHWEAGEALELPELPVEKLSAGAAPIAALTGTGTKEFSKAECAALAAYVKAGGILVIDSCGGDNDFRLSVRDKLLPGAFGEARKVPMPKEIAGPMKLRTFAMEKRKGIEPEIEVRAMGKGIVIVSALDLTSGLLGTNTWGIDGYQPSSAQAFLKKVVEWGATRLR